MNQNQPCYQNMRYAITDPIHYNNELWSESNMLMIQKEVAIRLENHSDVGKYIIVDIDQIKHVMDSISQSNPRIGLKEVTEMIISYITSYIANEYSINKKPAYNKDVLTYDGSHGIVRMSSGQLGIRKKGLNPIGRMF